MKYLKQLGIILSVTLLAELFETILPFPIPASIYGLALMLFLLVTGIVKLKAVKETADFLIEIMPLMFIPAAAGLIDSYRELDGILVPIVIITVLTTVVVMAVTGKTAQWIICSKNKKAEEKKERS